LAGREKRFSRGLVAFWALILAATAAGIGYLQYLGPPPAAPGPVAPAPDSASPPLASLPAASPAVSPAAPVIGQLTVSGGAANNRPAGAAIPAPDPKLLVAADSNPEWLVPQIGADGATPMRAYAAGSPPAAGAAAAQPQVAVMVAGLGNDIAQSLTATSILPPEISLALSPYGQQLPATEAAARATGHEMILILPMPALMTTLPLTSNQATLDWSMGQVQGFAGVSDAFGPDMSGGFLSDPASKSWLLTNIATRGLFFIEGNPGGPAPPLVWGRTADLVINPANGPQDEPGKLAELTADAQTQHAALGVMVNPTPDAIRYLASWAARLAGQGIRLVPVSALVLPPPAAPQPATVSTKP
jgi:polysaccharide deacetylase 2 family uncharacterized protein YibQ